LCLFKEECLKEALFREVFREQLDLM
jgi:hypothetical protein